MSEQLALALDVPVVAAIPRPHGLDEVVVGGIPYLNDVGDEHPIRVFGWYYGYPPCCVEAFIDRVERRWRDKRHAAPLPPHHPVSGHILCPACEAGPLAPLPPRPAERLGFILCGEGGQPSFKPPSLRSAWGRLRRE
jgi:hypothetical protein